MSKFKGLYSAVDEAAKALKRGKGTGKEFMTEVLKTPGVKPTEIKERGLQKIEAMPKMTKEEFLKKIEENPAPKLEEVGYAEDPSQIAFSDAFYKAVGHLPKNKQLKAWMDIPDKERNKMIFSASNRFPYEGETKYEKWTVPGGANYREILIKTPSTSSRKVEGEIKELRKEYDEYEKQAQEIRKQFPIISERPPEAQTALMEFREKQAAVENQMREARKGSKSYHSSHWEDQPNVLAHIRVSDREGANGEQILHVEEIQSDWHQAGRKKGYASGEEPAQIEALLNQQQELKKLRRELHNKAGALPDGREDEFISLMDQANDITPQVMKLQTEIDKLSDLQRTGVPDAPFKKNWHELAMKRILNYAAEHGYDKVAITPGAEQASRYDLSKQVDALHLTKEPQGKVRIWADKADPDSANGRAVMMQKLVSEKDLPDYVGKDLAEKAMADLAEKEAGHSVEYSGLDLQVGGEGMKGFYDKIIPDYLNSYGKKYGVQVTPMDIITHEEQSIPQIAAPGIDYFPEPVVQPAKTAQVHSFDITPQMREEIAGKGLPLYQQIGIPAGGAAAGAGALEGQEEPGFAEGGPVMAAKGGEFNTDPDMADGGVRIQGPVFKKGGRVNVTDNPDTMWLELVSKN